MLSARRNGLGVVLALLAGALVLGAVWVAANRRDLALASFTDDPTHWLRGSSYTGLVSNLGVLAWWAGAVAAIIAGRVLLSVDRGEPGSFLLAGGLITALLGLDDLFQLHERVFPRVTGLNERSSFGLYLLLVVALLLRFPRRLHLGAAWSLWLGVGLLALSVFVDHEHLSPEGAGYWLEDGTKLLGSIAWSGFFVQSAVLELQAATGDVRRRPSA